MPRGGQPEEELKALLPTSIAVRFEEMFPATRNGRIKRRDRKRAEMLCKAEPVLQRALNPMEVVRFTTNGVRQLTWWLLTAGSMNPFANRTTLVLTDRRVLLIHTDSKQQPRMFANQLPLERIRSTSGRNSYIFIRSGREQLMFHGVKRSEARQLKGLLESTATKKGGWQNLCPRCFTATDDAPLSCEKCGEEFKSPKKAGLRSLLFPGLGDFYLHRRGTAPRLTRRHPHRRRPPHESQSHDRPPLQRRRPPNGAWERYRLETAGEDANAVDLELFGGGLGRVLAEGVGFVWAGLFDLEAGLFDLA